MYIETVTWIPNIVDKLLAKHQVSQWEVEDVLLNFPEYRFVERGRRKVKTSMLLLVRRRQVDIS